MADPDYVQLPSDATANKNKIRSFSIIDDEGVTVLQQVAVLADEEGRVLGTSAFPLRVESVGLQDAMERLIDKIDQLLMVLD